MVRFVAQCEARPGKCFICCRAFLSTHAGLFIGVVISAVVVAVVFRREAEVVKKD
jgi:hypothetical protein